MKEQNKNSGFSLIELVVVLAIMGVAVLFSVEIYGNISTTDLKSAAENTDSMFSLLREHSITKANDYKLKISSNADDEFEVSIYENKKKKDAAGNEVDNWVKTGNSVNLGNKITITCLKVNDDTTEYELKDGKTFEAICSKSNGSYKATVVKDSSGNVLNGTESTNSINRLILKKGKHTKTIKLVIPTGRHFIE